MTRFTFATLITLLLPAATAQAQVSFAPAPDATLLFGSLNSGQSDNIGPALGQVLDNHWVTGACTSANDFATCDSIRFGMTVYADASCTDSINVQVSAQEDGGKLVEQRAQSIHNEGGTTFCDNDAFRPDDAGLSLHHKWVFPEGAAADPLFELPQYWERPRLTLMFIGELPQTGNGNPDDRIIDALGAACTNYEGAGGILPSMPTWTFITRRFDHHSVPYAGLLAAAGGTGECCYGTPCNTIDVCDHIADGRTDAKIRADILAGRYKCGPGAGAHSTGPMDFGTANQPNGTLPGTLWARTTTTTAPATAAPRQTSSGFSRAFASSRSA